MIIVISGSAIERYKRTMDDDGEERFLRTYETPVEVMGKLLLFTLFMFSFPIVTFFVFKWYLFEAVFSYPGGISSIYAAIPAIISVNLVIAAYIYVAWHSEPSENDSSTAEQKKTE